MRMLIVLMVPCLLLVFSGCDRLPFLQKKEIALNEEDQERGLSEIGSAEILTPKEKHKINRLFLLEMYEQIYAKRLKDTTIYQQWMNVLEQGASIEGVYRGMILSSEYAQLERGVVSKEARDFFATEMAYLESIKNTKIENSERLSAAIAEQVEKVPLFTLKRLLGERLLEIIDRKKQNREDLANLYSDLVLRWGKANIDFGFAVRNNKERNFHYTWALKNSRGRIQWELLNRLHRVLNFYGKIVYTK